MSKTPPAEPVRAPLDLLETMTVRLIEASEGLNTVWYEPFEIAEGQWREASAVWRNASSELSKLIRQWFQKSIDSQLHLAADTSLRAATAALTAFTLCPPPQRQWIPYEAEGKRGAVASTNDPKCIEAVERLKQSREVARTAVLDLLDYRGWATTEVQKARKPRGSGAVQEEPTKGGARSKLIAALSHHHGYDEGSCTKSDPITSNGLAKLAGVGSTSTSWKFFQVEFGGHAKYVTLCRKDMSGVERKLKQLQGEFTDRDMKPVIERAIELDRASRND